MPPGCSGWLEEWLQTEWPELEVYCNSVTEQWCTVGIAGPLARDLLADVSDNIDLGADAFPFMSCRQGIVAGIPGTGHAGVVYRRVIL